MPPALAFPATYAVPSPNLPSHYSTTMRAQWTNPHDVLSVLMLLGSDIVQRAIAQLSGSGPFRVAPVAFSFGWLAYSLSMLASAIGDGRLLPPPDCPSVLVNARSGYARTNQSWVLGRLLRDEEHRLERLYPHAHGASAGAKGVGVGAGMGMGMGHHAQGRGLTVAVYRTSCTGETGVPARDWVYWAGVGVIASQLAIASAPFFMHGNWVVFLVTLAGTLLACGGSALPQWRREKYAARPLEGGKREVSCLTRGNGAPVVMVFIAESGLRMEDLAGAKSEHCRFTLGASVALCVLWILLLFTVQGLDGDAWFLFGIGALGMVQNVVAAGARRTPSALGFHFRRESVIYRWKVMDALMDAERTEPGVGVSLLPVFFPGTLREEEQRWWDARRHCTKEKGRFAERRLGEDVVKMNEKSNAAAVKSSEDRATSRSGTDNKTSNEGLDSSASSITARSISPPGEREEPSQQRVDAESSRPVELTPESNLVTTSSENTRCIRQPDRDAGLGGADESTVEPHTDIWARSARGH